MAPDRQDSSELLNLDRLNRGYWHGRLGQLKAELQQPLSIEPRQPSATPDHRYGQRQARALGVEGD
ncbi:MAG TPA: hypothetical protein V6C65_27480 [Allocoleopsis sp.]